MPDSTATGPIAIVLPPGESFGPHSSGAVGLLVQRLAVAPSAFQRVVIGAPQHGATFQDVAFLPVRLPWLPLPRGRRYAAGIARLLARRPPALIEVHNRPTLALALQRRFPGVPVALFLHNDPQGMRSARSRRARAALLDRLAAVVTVSDFLRRRLLAGLAPPLRPPEVQPNCLDLDALPPRQSPASREALILFAGRVVADKGADTFVEACARLRVRLPGWRAVMIGGDRFGPNNPETRFIRALRPRAAAAGVTLAGYRPHAEVQRALAAAAIAVVPSRWEEPFGLAALEAMAAGAALVCTGRGGLPEVAGEAALYVPPDDPAALADAIAQLAGDPARRTALVAAGLSRAQGFGVPQAAAALDGLRRRLLGL